MRTRPVLFGADGQPLAPSSAPEAETRSRDAAVVKSMYDTLNSYLQGLGFNDASAITRAQEPINNHVWVYAAAMAISMTAASAPFVIMRETGSTVLRRKEAVLRSGRKWSGPKAGYDRRALERYIEIPAAKRLQLAKTLEPDYEHPAYNLLRRPNPVQSNQQFFQFLFMWLATRGELFWLYADDEGMPIARDQATQVWPYGPDYFRPVYSRSTFGKLIGWWFTVPSFSPVSDRTGVSAKVAIALDQVSQFKLSNPVNPIRGMSRLTAAAMSIETSLLAKGHNRALLKNNGVPRGLIVHDTILDEKEEREFLEKWNERYLGEGKSGRTGLLGGGFKYQQLSLSPDDMQFLGQEELSRLEVLAVMNTPPSILGITDTTNYATAQVQENGFWAKNILPTMKIVEAEVDSTLLFQETDNVVGVFDVSGIDALRAGISDKILMADKLASAPLHTPPRTAFEVVGLEVPEYEGDQIALLSGMLSTVAEITNPPDPTPPPAPTPADPTSPVAAPATPDPTSTANSLSFANETSAQRQERISKIRIAKARKQHTAFFKVVRKHVVGVKSGYRAWVESERKRTLARFDRHTKAIINIDAIVSDIVASQSSLKQKTLSARKKAMQAAGIFTNGDLETLAGVPVVDLGSTRIAQYFNRRTEAFADTVSSTLNKKLRYTLTQGINDGETVQELRMRIANVYDIAAGSSKALMVARTETANLMNGIRDQVFAEAGIDVLEWVDSGDDIVRESHQIFGSAGPQPRGFNYMDLIDGGTGTLTVPGDLDGPAAEVINCRCMMIPAG